MSEKHKNLKDVFTRMDALTDGVFAIVATLLVLDIKLPEIPEHHTQAQLVESVKTVLPSFIAFAFSFLTVIVYWINHEHIAKWITHYNYRMKSINLFFLFWICLIPFPTKFISEYPTEKIAVFTYALVMFMVAASARWLFNYLAFKTDAMHHSIPLKIRKEFSMKATVAAMYVLAVIASFFSVYISIGLFILNPILFLVLPKAELAAEE
jgi:uncharacterized membrane protein